MRPVARPWGSYGLYSHQANVGKQLLCKCREGNRDHLICYPFSLQCQVASHELQTVVGRSRAQGGGGNSLHVLTCIPLGGVAKITVCTQYRPSRASSGTLGMLMWTCLKNSTLQKLFCEMLGAAADGCRQLKQLFGPSASCVASKGLQVPLEGLPVPL